MPKLSAQPAAEPAKRINNIAPSLAALVVDIASLKPDPDNARVHGDVNMSAIKASLDRYGQLSPVVVRKGNRTVMSGNGRLRAAKELGWTKIAAVFHDMDDVTAAGYGLADNRTAELAEWDAATVRRLDALIRDAGEGSIGWTAEQIRALRVAEHEGRVDPDSIPPQPPPVAKLGDLWLLGRHRLLCGDSLDPKAVARLMDGSKAVLMATDPPYGVDFGKANYCPTAKQWGAIKGDQREGGDLRIWLSDVLKLWLGVMDDAAAYYVWSASLAEGHRFYEAIIDAGLHVQSQIIWVKNRFALGQADYQWMHEPAWYAFRKGAKHHWLGGRDKTTVWDVSKVTNSEYLHPTQKPVELFKRPMIHHTLADDICAEPFSGSGSQLIAAEVTGRVCYAMELDPRWVDVAVKRWELHTGLKAKKAGAPPTRTCCGSR